MPLPTHPTQSAAFGDLSFFSFPLPSLPCPFPIGFVVSSFVLLGARGVCLALRFRRCSPSLCPSLPLSLSLSLSVHQQCFSLSSITAGLSAWNLSASPALCCTSPPLPLSSRPPAMPRAAFFPSRHSHSHLSHAIHTVSSLFPFSSSSASASSLFPMPIRPHSVDARLRLCVLLCVFLISTHFLYPRSRLRRCPHGEAHAALGLSVLHHFPTRDGARSPASDRLAPCSIARLFLFCACSLLRSIFDFHIQRE